MHVYVCAYANENVKVATPHMVPAAVLFGGWCDGSITDSAAATDMAAATTTPSYDNNMPNENNSNALVIATAAKIAWHERKLPLWRRKQLGRLHTY